MNRVIASVKNSLAAIVLVAGCSVATISQAADEQENSKRIGEEQILGSYDLANIRHQSDQNILDSSMLSHMK